MGGRQPTVPALSVVVRYAFIDILGSGRQTSQEALDVHCNREPGTDDNWQHTLLMTRVETE